jgi:glycosyltransferase involved in cell wall biosynthesis
VSNDHITVCVCTFKRPALLESLLAALSVQRCEDKFSFDVVVVDNDSARSAEAVVGQAAGRYPIQVSYDCEMERNISLTRNRAIRNATGNLIAFIDDDEHPQTDWLLRLHEVFAAYPSDGVLAPVIPEFPPAAPAWLRKAGVFSRRRLATGARIAEGDGRTGNVLLRRKLFTDDGCWFDPAYGRTGGEDSDFFHRQFEKGGVFVWCDEAAVTETVPPDRWTATFHVKRLLRAGTTDGELMRSGKLAADGLIARNAVILLGCALATPLSVVLLPKHLWMRVAQKLAYCGGLVSAYCGFSILRYRD